MPDTIAVRERLPPGASAVLINRTHTCRDLYLPIDPRQETLLAAVNGKRSIAEIAPRREDLGVARELFQSLWLYDQVVLDTSRAARPR